MQTQQAAPPAHDTTGQATILDFTLLIAEHLRVLFLLPMVAAFVALAVTFVMPNTYTATTRLLVPVQQNPGIALAAQVGPLAGVAGGLSLIKSPGDQYVSLLRSQSVADALIQRFDLREVYGQRYIEDARRELKEHAKIVLGMRDSIISIEVEDRLPRRAADIANAYVEELRRLTNSLAITEAGQRRLFFETQLKQSKENLAKAEIALRTSGVSEAALKTMPQSALEVIARLKAQVTAQEIKLAALRMFMTESNPEFSRAKQELAALRLELAKAEENSPSKVHAEGSEYVAKYRDFRYHESLFELMAKQYEFARIEEAQEGAVIQVVDAARPPERASKPRRLLTATLSALAVFFIALMAVVVRQAFRHARAQPDGLEKAHRLSTLLRLRRT